MTHVPHRRWSALGVILVAISWPAAAQNTSGAGFYPFIGNARTIGMAGAYTAVSDDTGGLLFNPAGMAQVATRQASVTQKVNGGTNYLALSYIEPVKEGKFGGGFTYLRASDGTGRVDKAFQFTYGQYVEKGLAFGVNVKYLDVRATATKDTGFSFDIGALYTPPSHPQWTVGLAVLDINEPSFKGLGLEKRIYNAGVAFRPDKQTVLALDWYDIGSVAKRGRVRFGAERQLTRNIQLRAGVTQQVFAVGASLTFKYVTIDYGFQRVDKAADLNMLSVVGNF